MINDCMSNEWSHSLKAATRKAIDNFEVLDTADCKVFLKITGGGFGAILMDDLVCGKLRVIDFRTGGHSVFGTTEAVIAAG